MGGQIAARLAAKRPDMVSAVVSIDGTLGFDCDAAQIFAKTTDDLNAAVTTWIDAIQDLFANVRRALRRWFRLSRQGLAQASDLAVKRDQLLCLHSGPGEQRFSETTAFFTECVAALSQRNPNASFVFARPRSDDQRGGFQPFDQGSYGAGFQIEPVRNGAYAASVFLPQYAQNQILRISDPELVEKGLVDAVDRHGRRIERETQLIFKGKVIGHGAFYQEFVIATNKNLDGRGSFV